MVYLLLFAIISSTSAFLLLPSTSGDCNCPAPPSCPPPKPCSSPPSCPPKVLCAAQGSQNYKKDQPDQLELRAKMLGAMDLLQSSDEQTMSPHMMIESLAEKYPLDQEPTKFVEPLTRNEVVKEDDSDLIPSNKGRRLVKRKATVDDSTTPKPIAEKEPQDDEVKKSSDELKCNSEALRQLMLENIGETTSTSKRRINDRAEEKFGGSVDVICSRGHFSYVYSSNLYCEATKDDITCIAFRQSAP